MKGFVSGLIFAFVLIVVIGLLAVQAGAFPPDAGASANPLVRWIAGTALSRAVAGAEKVKNPLAIDAANEIAGLRLYVKDCAVCHGTSDARPSATAQGLYRQPPQFAKNGVEDTAGGQTFYTIQHGIRFTGMPAFGKVLSDTQAWQITMFLHRMDKLAPPAQVLWHTIPTSDALIATNWKLPANWRALARQSGATRSPTPLPSDAQHARPTAAART